MADNDPPVKAGGDDGDAQKPQVDAGNKINKGDADDVSRGPVANRGCTDILCLGLFLAHWVLFAYIAIDGFAIGNPYKVIRPVDTLARTCGMVNDEKLMIDKETTPIDLTLFTTSAWTMNPEAIIGAKLLQQLCASKPAFNNILAAGNKSCNSKSSACWKNFENACKTDQGSNLDLDELQKDPVEAMKKYFTKGMSSKTSNPLTALSRFTNNVCVSSCRNINFFVEGADYDATHDSEDDKKNTAEALRNWDFKFNKDVLWSEAWNELIDMMATDGNQFDNAPFSTMKKLLDDSKMKALPFKICPYPAQHCLYVPGIKLQNMLKRCVFDMSVIAEGAKVLADSEVANQLSGGFGDAMGTIMETWYVFIIVAFIILAVGMVFMVVLRFTVGLFVWIAVLITVLLLPAAGAYAYWYGTACKGLVLDTNVIDAFNAQKIELCGEGDEYLTPDPSLRQTYTYISYFLFGLGVLYLLIICCLRNRIRLAIALNKVAARFVFTNKKIIVLPAVQILISLVWLIVWICIALYVISATQVLPTDPKAGTFEPVTYTRAYGVAGAPMAGWIPDSTAIENSKGIPGVCTGQYPAAPIWKDTSAPGCTCVGVEDCDVEKLECYKCGEMPFDINRYHFWIILLSLFWLNATIIAVGQTTIAGAVGVWYFNQDNIKATSPVATGLKNCFRYHLGSLVFGSLILAVVQVIKWWLRFWQKQLEAQKNAVLAKIAGCMACCVHCFERFIKFLNKNAYIRIALVGENFCKSAWKAFCLILRNAARYAVIGGLSGIITGIGTLFIMAGGGALGYFILLAIFPEVNPWCCVALYCIMGYVGGKIVMQVFGLSVDSCLVCFLMDEELNGRPQYAPAELTAFYS